MSRASRRRQVMTRVEFRGGPLDGSVGDVPMELEYATLKQLKNYVAVPDPDAPVLPMGRKADIDVSAIDRSSAQGRYGRRQLGEDAGFVFVWYPDEEF